MTEKEKAAQWRDKITKKLEVHKELQMKELPELIKLIKAWEVAINASADAAARVGEVWTRLSDTFGRETEWGQSFANIAGFQKKMVAMEEQWARTLEEKFVMPVSITLTNELKQTMTKETDVKKALKKYEGVLKAKGSWARKESKRGESMVSAMNELNDTVKEIEEKREKIWNDVQWHCSQSYFILLQALTITMKEKFDFYEKGVANANQFKPLLETAQKVQPDKSLQVKQEDLAVLYSDVDEFVKEKKSSRKAGTLSKRAGSSFAVAAASASLDHSTSAVPLNSPTTAAIARSGEHSVRATWAPQSAARLEEALNAMSRGPSIPPDSARGQASQPASSLGGPRPPGSVRVRAKWGFTAEREGELSMNVGDVLLVLDQTNQNWWMAEANGKRGVIPANYLEVLPDEPALPDEPPALPTISLPTGTSPRGDSAFDKDGLPQFPPTSPHGLSAGNGGRIGGVSSGITPRKHSAGQQSMPMPAVALGGPSPRGRPVSTMGFVPSPSSLGGGGPPQLAPALSVPSGLPSVGMHLPPPVASPRLPALPSPVASPRLPPPPEADLPPPLPVLPPIQVNYSSGSLPPVPAMGGFSPRNPEQIPPPPPHDPPAQKEDAEWQQFFTDDGHPYLYNPRTGESRWV